MKQNSLLTRMMLLVALVLMGAGTAWAQTTVTDELTQSWTGITGTSYSDWSGKTSNSDAVYAGNSAGGNSSIQLRSNNSNSGIVTTTSGGKVKKITVTWNSNTTNGRTLNVYGKNSAYSSASDLYNNSNQGTLLGTIVKGTSTELTISGDYEYVGFRSASGAMYLSEVDIVWETGGGSNLTGSDLAITGAPITLSFDLYNNSSAQTVNFTTSSTGAVTVSGGEGYVTTSVSGNTVTVTPVAVTPSTQTITISQEADETYAAGSKSFTVTVTNSDPNVPGSENTPYTVDQARTAIDANVGLTDVYATGIVSEIVTEYSSQYSNITFDFVDDGGTNTLRAYRCVGTEAANVAVGDVVVVKGNLTKYGDIYEFGQGCTLVSLTHPVNTTPSITLSTNTIEATAAETDGTINVTYNNITSVVADVYFCDANGDAATYDWIHAEINNENNVYYVIAANTGAARTAYMKVYALDDKAQYVYSELITVTQAKYVADYATLPFEFDGGKSDIANTAGLTQEGLGSDYNSSPKLKFDGTGDYVILKFNERPGKLTFTIKGNGFSGGTFKVQTSVDGTTFSDLETYTDLSSSLNEEFDNLGENVRYIKWIYTEKNSGNVALGDIELKAYSATPTPVTYTLSWTAGANTELFVFDAADTSNPLTNGEGVAAGTTIQVSVDVEQGYEIESLLVDGTNVADQIDQTGVYEFTMPEHDVTITSSATAISVTPATAASVTFDFTDNTSWSFPEGSGNKTVDADDYSDGTYTINVAGSTGNGYYWNTEGYLLMGKQGATLTLPAFSFNVSKIKVYGTSTASTAVKQNIYVGDEAVSTETEGAKNVVNVYEIAAAQQSAGTIYTLKVTSAHNTQISKIEIYGYENKAISAAGYATYCSSNALDYSAVAGLTAYKATATGSAVSFSEVTEVPANAGVLLKGAEGTYQIPVIATAAALTDNVFEGVIAETEITTPGIFVLMNGNSGVGFYKTKATFTVGANTAYLPANVAAGRSFIGFDGNETTGISAVNGEGFMVNGPVFDLQGRRVAQPQKGLYIVNGRKVVVK